MLFTIINHYGHQTSMGHLRISETERLAIAAKLANGVGIQRILDDIRDSIGSSYPRIHLLTRKDRLVYVRLGRTVLQCLDINISPL